MKLYKKYRSAFRTVAILFKGVFKKYPIMVFAALLVIGITFASFVVLQKNTVNVFEDDVLVSSFYSFNSDDADLLEEANVSLAAGDEYDVEWDGSTANLTLKRAISVVLKVDGGEIFLKTQPCTVAQLLEQQKIQLTESDTVSPSLDSSLDDGATVLVTRIINKTYTKTVDIAYDTVEKTTKTLFEGQTKVKKAGVKGQKTITYHQVIVDGVIKETTVTSEEITKKPETEIVLVGTKKKPTVATASDLKGVSGAPSSYKAVYKMKATAYTYGDDGGNITATGIVPYHGIVAVDPSVIPLGSKLYIASSDGSYVYGYAIAADTGGAIKGNRIDLFLESNSAVKNFGRRNMIVYVCN